MVPVGMPRILLGLYFFCVVYGSFFPFRFDARPEAIRHNLDTAVFWPYDAAGHRIFSIPDVASNVILGLPLGLLLVAAYLAGPSLSSRLLGSGLLALLIGAAVEAGQIFTPGRTTSALDVICQVIGSVAGAAIGHAALGATRDSPGAHARRLLRGHPALGPLGALLLILAADALYPYAVTLDVSTVWSNVKDATWHPLAGWPAWHAVVMERLLPYAALGVLAAMALRAARVVSHPRLTAWLLASAYALGLEAAKIFIEGRAPAAAHVLTAAAGALLGVLIPAVRLLSPAVLAVIAAAVLAYQELAPFDVVWSASHWATRLRDAEWLPFASYYWAEPQAALFDAGKKLLLGGLVGAAFRDAGIGAPAVWAGALAMVLEAAQIVERSHHAALGDALILTAGAVGGAALLARYRAMLDSG
jgi:VanZ family protein